MIPEDLESESDSMEVQEIQDKPKFQLIAIRVMPPFVVALVLLLILCLIALYCLFYLGCLWDPVSKLGKVPVAFVNMDQGFDFSNHVNFKTRIERITGNRKSLGDLLESQISGTKAKDVLKWEFFSTNVSFGDVQNKLESGDYWGILVIPKNFSNNFLTNVKLPNETKPIYQGNNVSLEYYYDQARQLSVTSMVSNVVRDLCLKLSVSFGDALLQEVELSKVGYSNLMVTPRYLLSPINCTITNIHEVPVWGMNFATYVAQIVLWITAIAMVTTMSKLFESRFDLIKAQMARSFFATRIVSTITLASAVYTLFAAMFFMFMVFLLNGSGDIVAKDRLVSETVLFLWLTAQCYFSMASLMYVTLGQEYFTAVASLLLIFQIATSNAILDPIVMHAFTNVTFGFPLYYSVHGLRCLLLGSQCNFMSRNVGVLLIWLFASLIIASLIGCMKLRGLVKAYQSEIKIKI
jgi:YhgE/Pip-like protein